MELDMRTLAAAVAGALWLAPGAPRAAPSLAAYADEAVRQNPEIRALRAGYDAQLARAQRAGAPPDPMLMVEWSMLPTKYPFSLYRTEMSGVEVSLQQEIPYPGKLRYAQESEKAAATALAARIDEAERNLRSAVAQAYFEMGFARRATELLRENERLLLDLTKHAEIQVSAGRALRQDVLRGREESAQLRARILDLEGRGLAAEARLVALLAREPQARIDPPPLPGPVPPLLPLSELLSRAERARPLLLARNADLEQSYAELRRARRDRYPNFLLGASYRFRAGPPDDMVQGSDFYSLKFGITLPLWYSSKQSAAVREAHARVTVRREEYEGERNRVLGEVRRLHAELMQLRKALPLYDDLIRPLSLETLKAAIAPYVTGQIDFHSVLQNWTRVVETDVERARVLFAVHAKSAELEAAVGAPLGVKGGP
jgi:outer membrane protein TolC